MKRLSTLILSTFLTFFANEVKASSFRARTDYAVSRSGRHGGSGQISINLDEPIELSLDGMYATSLQDDHLAGLQARSNGFRIGGAMRDDDSFAFAGVELSDVVGDTLQFRYGIRATIGAGSVRAREKNLPTWWVNQADHASLNIDGLLGVRLNTKYFRPFIEAGAFTTATYNPGGDALSSHVNSSLAAMMSDGRGYALAGLSLHLPLKHTELSLRFIEAREMVINDVSAFALPFFDESFEHTMPRTRRSLIAHLAQKYSLGSVEAFAGVEHVQGSTVLEEVADLDGMHIIGGLRARIEDFTFSIEGRYNTSSLRKYESILKDVPRYSLQGRLQHQLYDSDEAQITWGLGVGLNTSVDPHIGRPVKDVRVMAGIEFLFGGSKPYRPSNVPYTAPQSHLDHDDWLTQNTRTLPGDALTGNIAEDRQELPQSTPQVRSEYSLDTPIPQDIPPLVDIPPTTMPELPTPHLDAPNLQSYATDVVSNINPREFSARYGDQLDVILGDDDKPSISTVVNRLQHDEEAREVATNILSDYAPELKLDDVLQATFNKSVVFTGVRNGQFVSGILLPGPRLSSLYAELSRQDPLEGAIYGVTTRDPDAAGDYAELLKLKSTSHENLSHFGEGMTFTIWKLADDKLAPQISFSNPYMRETRDLTVGRAFNRPFKPYRQSRRFANLRRVGTRFHIH
jgi:hypothetical protein